MRKNPLQIRVELRAAGKPHDLKTVMVIHNAQPDPEILRRAQRGDERAFALIVHDYETPIFNYVLRLTGDRNVAEDLTQETFLEGWRCLATFQGRGSLRSWLHRIAHRQFLRLLLGFHGGEFLSGFVSRISCATCY